MPVLRRRLPSQGLTPCSARAGQAACPGEPRVVWRFSDAKAGHDSQSLGLVDALQRRLALDSYDIPVSSGAALDWFRGQFPTASLLPDPWLLIGAGHATHLPLLAARRARGGRAVVLMTPDLPKRCFDLCVVPDHDRPRPAPNVLTTRGSLNRMQAVTSASGSSQHRRGLLMIGGPSRHYHWDHQQIVEQLAGVIRYSPVRHWVLTTSRRTPPGFAECVRDTAVQSQSQAYHPLLAGHAGPVAGSAVAACLLHLGNGGQRLHDLRGPYGGYPRGTAVSTAASTGPYCQGCRGTGGFG